MNAKRIIHPQEVELYFLMPAIRREMAISMKSKGMRNKDIALRLGVTGAAISQYFTEKRAKDIKFDLGFKSEIEKSCTKIKDKDSLVREMQRLVRIARDEKLICKIHKNFSDIRQECDLCFAR